MAALTVLGQEIFMQTQSFKQKFVPRVTQIWVTARSSRPLPFGHFCFFIYKTVARSLRSLWIFLKQLESKCFSPIPIFSFPFLSLADKKSYFQLKYGRGFQFSLVFLSGPKFFSVLLDIPKSRGAICIPFSNV